MSARRTAPNPALEPDALVRAAVAKLSSGDLPVFLVSGCAYFHNGAAATLLEVVDLYDQRFTIALTTRQKQRLVASLSSL